MNNNNSNQSEGGKEDLNELTKSLKVMKSLSILSFCCSKSKDHWHLVGAYWS